MLNLALSAYRLCSKAKRGAMPLSKKRCRPRSCLSPRSLSVIAAISLCAVLATLPSAEVLANGTSTIGVKESYALPISQPFDQGDSDLCWIYATLNMLETNYLHRHPGSKIELSRAALQRESIADRFRRTIEGSSTHLEDGGIAVDALALIRAHGLVARSDFHDIADSDPIFISISRGLARLHGEKAKLQALDESLTADLGAVPVATHLDGKTLASQATADAVLGDDVWGEYDVTKEGSERVAPSDDPDARPGTNVHYVKLSTVVDLIHQSLMRGEAVVWGSTDNHALLIYGGDYNLEGQPISYLIKDSFRPYSYRAPAEAIHRILTDVTVVVSHSAEALSARN